MTFIENLFGLSVDHGSGASEVALLISLYVIVTMVWLFYQLRGESKA